MEAAIIHTATTCLSEGGILLYPTDTLWGIGCDATNAAAVSTIFAIKKRVLQKSFVVLVADIQMLRAYTEVPLAVENFLRTQTRPTSVVYENVRALAPNAYASDGSVAIRIVQTPFTQRLIRGLGKPLISTSANISGAPSPMNFKEISSAITQKMDFIIPEHCAENALGRASQIVRFLPDFTPIYLRK